MILTTRELLLPLFFFFFCSDPAPTEIYTLSLHDALPILRAYFAASPRMNSAKAPGELSAISRPCARSEEHTSELQSRVDLVCRLLLEKKKCVLIEKII